jgi:hypothetical protein
MTTTITNMTRTEPYSERNKHRILCNTRPAPLLAHRAFRAHLRERDIWKRDIGERDIGERDIGERDIGVSNIRERDIGERDIGETVSTC